MTSLPPISLLAATSAALPSTTRDFSRILQIAKASLQDFDVLVDKKSKATFIVHKRVEFDRRRELQAKQQSLDWHPLSDIELAYSSEERFRQFALDLVVNDDKLSFETFSLGITPTALYKLAETLVRRKFDGVHVFRFLEPNTSGVHEVIQVTQPIIQHIFNRGNVIGKGGGGIIFRCYDLTLRKIVVIKEAQEFDPALVSAIEGEWYASSRLICNGTNYPGITRQHLGLYKIDKPGNQRCGLVTDLYAKGDLAGRIAELSLPQRFVGCVDLCQAGARFNAIVAINADIKIENILVDELCRLFVGDFDRVLEINAKELCRYFKSEETSTPGSSTNSIASNDHDWLKLLGMQIKALYSECQALQKELRLQRADSPQSSTALMAQLKKKEAEMDLYLEMYRKMARNIHTWAIGYAILQLLTGKILKRAQDVALSVEEKLKLLDDIPGTAEDLKKIKGIKKLLKKMLVELPKAPASLTVKTPLLERIDAKTYCEEMSRISAIPLESPIPLNPTRSLTFSAAGAAGAAAISSSSSDIKQQHQAAMRAALAGSLI